MTHPDNFDTPLTSSQNSAERRFSVCCGASVSTQASQVVCQKCERPCKTQATSSGWTEAMAEIARTAKVDFSKAKRLA